MKFRKIVLIVEDGRPAVFLYRWIIDHIGKFMVSTSLEEYEEKPDESR